MKYIHRRFFIVTKGGGGGGGGGGGEGGVVYVLSHGAVWLSVPGPTES